MEIPSGRKGRNTRLRVREQLGDQNIIKFVHRLFTSAVYIRTNIKISSRAPAPKEGKKKTSIIIIRKPSPGCGKVHLIWGREHRCREQGANGSVTSNDLHSDPGVPTVALFYLRLVIKKETGHSVFSDTMCPPGRGVTGQLSPE